MKVKFEFASIGDVFEQSFKLVILAVAVAIVNYLIGDDSGIVAILSLFITSVSQFIRLLSLLNRYHVALQDLTTALPSLDVGREDVATVEGLADYIDDSLDAIEEKYEANLASLKVETEMKIQQLESGRRNLEAEIKEKEGEIEEAKRALKQAWEDKKRAVEQGRGEVERMKKDLMNSQERIKLLEEGLNKYKEIDVFLSGDNEAIKAKYLSIINRNNANKRQ